MESELRRYKVDIAAVLEIRWKDTNMVELKDYVLINSGHSKNILWIGFLIKKAIKHTLLKYKLINERICLIRLKGS